MKGEPVDPAAGGQPIGREIRDGAAVVDNAVNRPRTGQSGAGSRAGHPETVRRPVDCRPRSRHVKSVSRPVAVKVDELTEMDTPVAQVIDAQDQPRLDLALDADVEHDSVRP